MQRDPNGSGIPGLVPPEVLIFFRIPKTGGNTMDGVFQQCLPDQHFHADVGPTDSALLVRSTKKIAEKLGRLPSEKQRAIRCLIGIHVAMDVETIFERPSKFFTIVRHPSVSTGGRCVVSSSRSGTRPRGAHAGSDLRDHRKRLADWNQYDIELHAWVKARFAAQVRPLEPEFSREVRRFETMNRLLQRAHRLSPKLIKTIARVVMK